MPQDSGDNISAVSPLPTASFVEYVNTAPQTKLDLTALYKLKEYQIRKKEMNDKLSAESINKMAEMVGSENNPANMTAYTEWQRAAQKQVGDILTEGTKNIKGIIAQNNFSPVDIANANLEMATKLRDPHIMGAMKEMQILGEMQKSIFTDTKGIYDPDEWKVYMHEISTNDKPLDRIDFERGRKIDLEGYLKSTFDAHTNEGSTLEDLSQYGLVSDTKKSYFNVDGFISDLVGKINQSPSFRRSVEGKAKAEGLTTDEWIQRQAEQHAASMTPVQGAPGIYSIDKDRQLHDVKYSPEREAAAKAEYAKTKGVGSTAGAGTEEDQMKYFDKRTDGFFNFISDQGLDKSMDPTVVANSYSQVMDDKFKATTAEQQTLEKTKGLFKQTLNEMGQPIVTRINPITGKPITDINGNLVDDSETYNSLNVQMNRNQVVLDNYHKMNSQIEEELTKKGLTNKNIAASKYKFQDYVDDIQIPGAPVTPTQEGFNKWLADRDPGYAKYNKEKENIIRNMIGKNSYNPISLGLNDKDYDYKLDIEPLMSGTSMENYNITDGSLNKIDPKNLKNKNFEFAGIVSDPYGGGFKIHMKSYTPAISNKAKVAENTTSARKYQVDKYDEGGDIYLSSDHMNSKVWNSLYAGTGDAVKLTRQSIDNQISATGVAEFKPGELEQHGFTIARDPSGLYDVFVNESANKMVHKKYNELQLNNFIYQMSINKGVVNPNPQNPNAPAPPALDAHTYISNKYKGTGTNGSASNPSQIKSKDYNWELFTAAEGKSDGTPDARDSGQGTVGAAQIHWASWGDKIVSSGIAKDEKDFRDHPEKQREAFDKIVNPYVESNLSNIESIGNLQDKLTTLKGTTGVNLLNDQGKPDEDKLKYMIYNMGADGAKNAISNVNLSPVKVKELNNGIERMIVKRDNSLVSAKDTIGPENVTAREGDTLVQRKHVSVIKNAVNKFGLTLTSGFRSKEENAKLPNASPTSNHMEGTAYDFSIKNLSKDQIQEAIKYFVANGANPKQTGVHNGTHIHVDFAKS